MLSIFEYAEQASSRGVLEGGGGVTGLLNKGGGSNRLPGVVTKQQAVEFPQVQTDTPFQLISGFFHANQGVLCLLSKLPPAVCWGGGGGGGGATGLLNEGGGS